MRRQYICGLVAAVVGCCMVSSAGWVSAGPKGRVTSKSFANRTITIDGSFADWPLSEYGRVSQQPLFPEAHDSISTDADGDHLVWEVGRIGPFNGTDLDAYDPQDPSEFGSAIYFGHDSQFLYVLGVFIDDELQGGMDESGFANFLNDGFEIFIDALGDSDDQADEIAFPAFDEEEPNLDDFQLTMALNEFFPLDQGGPNDLGARQHMERAGTFDIIKEGYEEVLADSEHPGHCRPVLQRSQGGRRKESRDPGQSQCDVRGLCNRGEGAFRDCGRLCARSRHGVRSVLARRG